MKRISISESTMEEALQQIDVLEGLHPRNKNCLRLLTEEMFSMVHELLAADKLDFLIDCENGCYTLRVSVKTRVDEEARKHFLSMSTDGRNAANHTLKGLLGAVMEAFYYDGYGEIIDASWTCGMHAMEGESTHVWALSRYIDASPRERAKSDWDGMEKSIIANFADDVTIGVRAGKLEMTVTKAFA